MERVDSGKGGKNISLNNVYYIHLLCLLPFIFIGDKESQDHWKWHFKVLVSHFR